MSAQPPSWAAPYLGKPFRRDASGPDAYDCYGLVVAVLRDHWGLETPALEGAHLLETHARLAAALEAPECPWAQVGDPATPGDVLTFLAGAGAELHVGIVVAEGWMLHAREDEGVALARTDRLPWVAFRIGPVFRHRGLHVG